jgi:hypothetical protein
MGHEDNDAAQNEKEVHAASAHKSQGPQVMALPETRLDTKAVSNVSDYYH